MKKRETWKKRLQKPNELPSPLTKDEKIRLMNIDSVKDVEEYQTFTSRCIKINGIYKQL